MYEENIPCPPMDTIKNEINATGLTISNLSVRTQKEITANENLFDMMNKNLIVLKKSLS